MKKSIKFLLLLLLGALCVFAQKEEKPKKSLTYEYFGFGPAGFADDEKAALFYLASIGQQWKINDLASIKFRGDGAMHFGDSKDSTDNYRYAVIGGLGMNFYFPVEDFTPYFGADFGFGSAIKHSTGFAFGVNLGLALFRKSGVYLSLEPTFQMILSGRYPALYGLKLGVNI